MATHVFVRPATALDARVIGAIHAQTLRAALDAALEGALTPDIEAIFVPDAFARQWEQAITAPPSSNHAVLCAVDEGTVVGFAAISPTQLESLDQADLPDGQMNGHEGTVVVEITALEVPLARGRAGHGSRLLAAATDLAREQGANTVQMWVLAGDDAHTSFLHEAGFAPTGLRRTMQVGTGMATQHCWYATLPEVEEGEPRA